MSWAKPEDAARWKAAFGQRLRTLREAQGMTQLVLAERSDLSVGYLSSVELGHRNISLVNTCVLAAALGLDPGDLVRGLLLP